MRYRLDRASSTPPDQAHAPGTLPDHLGGLLARCLAGWRPPALSFHGAGTFIWNDGEFELPLTAIREEQGALVAETAASTDFAVQVLNQDLRNKPCSGILGDGRRFAAEMGHLSTTHLGEDSTCTFECSYWTVSPDSSITGTWIASVKMNRSRWLELTNIGLDLHVLDEDGNRVLRCIRHLLHLQGQYTYLLLPPEGASEEATLLIDAGNTGLPLCEVVRQEFRAIEFILGQRLHLGAMVAVDPCGTAVAHAGGPFGLQHARAPYPSPNRLSPVSQSATSESIRGAGQFAATLFQRVTAMDREHPECGLRGAMSWYLLSTDDVLEGSALKLHVALEGLASKLLDLEADKIDKGDASESAQPLYFTVRHADWKAWCKEHTAKIIAMSRPDAGGRVLDAVRRADRPGASSVVKTMFRHYRLTVTQEMEGALRARDELVHEARLPDESDIDKALLHESIPRTMLVALLSKAVGYNGPIIDYNGLDPTWWPSRLAGKEEEPSRIMSIELSVQEWHSYGGVLPDKAKAL